MFSSLVYTYASNWTAVLSVKNLNCCSCAFSESESVISKLRISPRTAFAVVLKASYAGSRLATYADERLEMLALLEDEDLEAEAIRRMAALNKEIANVEDLNENYHIGASYFLKLKTLTFDQLWTDYLQPLLREYVQGMYDEEGLMSRFAKAYGYQKSSVGDVNEAAQNQG